MSQKIFSQQNIYLIVSAIVALSAIFIVGIVTYRGSKAVEEENLRERAETIMLSIDPREITFLKGDTSDLANPLYLSLKSRLKNIRSANQDIRFIYLAGERHDGIFFYLDSEPENSPAYSPPGQTYSEASQIFRAVFRTGLSRFEGPLRDRYGDWVSAFAAINRPGTGERLAVLGLDVDASEYRKQIALAVMAPISLVIFLFLVFLIGYVQYRKEDKLLSLKARFLSIASHDLRSPLSGVLWAIESLQKRQAVKNDPDASRTVENIKKTLELMRGSIQGILESSRVLRVKNDGEAAHSVNLLEVVSEVIGGLAFFALERKVKIYISEYFPRAAFARAPPEKVRHIFFNILSNAIKYSRSGGIIAVRYSKTGGGGVVSLEDYGIGISEEDKKKIFTANFHGENASRDSNAGAGLGLYFTKRLVDECGGKIWFISEKNIGTKFYVQFPADLSLSKS